MDNNISETVDVAIIGGGAAGFFMAANLAEMCPQLRITIFEKTTKLLTKVLVSGGGRCNVTHACFDNQQLAGFYPRGGKQLRKVFGKFAVQDTIDWFKRHGVALKAEGDGRMFPVTNSSQTIANCLLQTTNTPNIVIKTQANVTGIEPNAHGFLLTINNQPVQATYVFLATGGYNKPAGYHWLKPTINNVEEPVPSLFTFNIPDDDIKQLPGLSVPNAEVRLVGTKLKHNGPALITHWGLSGPAVLKLSAWGARLLHDADYQYQVAISWAGITNQEEMRQQLTAHGQLHAHKLIRKAAFGGIPRRLWDYLCDKSGVPEQQKWQQLGGKTLNKIILTLCDDRYNAEGKTTYKDEFVTAGGIQLADVDMLTMESKQHKGLYFGGEVLNVDGVTGGFNFQAAWSTAYIAATSITNAQKEKAEP